MPPYDSSSILKMKASEEGRFKTAFASNSQPTRTASKVKNLRERLLGLGPEASSSLIPAKRTADQAGLKPAVSTSAIFQKLQAGFQDKRESKEPSYKQQVRSGTHLRHFGYPITSSDGSSSPSTGEHPLYLDLKGEYIGTALTLHEMATTQLASVQTDLEGALSKVVVADSHALEEDQSYRDRMSLPLSAFVVSTQVPTSEGQVKWRQETVEELVKTFREQLEKSEGELDGLWTEWEAAQREVQSVLMEFTSDQPWRDLYPHVADQTIGFNSLTSGPSVSGILGEFRKEMQDIKQDLEALVEANNRQMKNVEKGFRATISRDFLLFHQSILE
ncbi:hypothetical protein GQ53DRAFT_840379 [Thozetella sp. PMI_491]|nr:hypothetical protein GQ53DRAFT_840379 [Thozetella sp. PMI_491]